MGLLTFVLVLAPAPPSQELDPTSPPVSTWASPLAPSTGDVGQLAPEGLVAHRDVVYVADPAGWIVSTQRPGRR